MSQEKEKNALGIEASIEDLFEQKARPFEECPREKNDKTKNITLNRKVRKHMRCM